MRKWSSRRLLHLLAALLWCRPAFALSVGSWPSGAGQARALAAALRKDGGGGIREVVEEAVGSSRPSRLGTAEKVLTGPHEVKYAGGTEWQRILSPFIRDTTKSYQWLREDGSFCNVVRINEAVSVFTEGSWEGPRTGSWPPQVSASVSCGYLKIGEAVIIPLSFIRGSGTINVAFVAPDGSLRVVFNESNGMAVQERVSELPEELSWYERPYRAD